MNIFCDLSTDEKKEILFKETQKDFYKELEIQEQIELEMIFPCI